jgi:hypothetical protein
MKHLGKQHFTLLLPRGKLELTRDPFVDLHAQTHLIVTMWTCTLCRREEFPSWTRKRGRHAARLEELNSHETARTQAEAMGDCRAAHEFAGDFPYTRKVPSLKYFVD